MKVINLSNEVRQKIESCRFDRIIGKHEGPWRWLDYLGQTEFLQLGEFWILLPIEAEYLNNVSLERMVIATDGNTLTLFLKDTTWTESPAEEVWDAGRIAICERVPGEAFFLTTVLHEWFMIQNPELDAI